MEPSTPLKEQQELLPLATCYEEEEEEEEMRELGLLLDHYKATQIDSDYVRFLNRHREELLRVTKMVKWVTRYHVQELSIGRGPRSTVHDTKLKPIIGTSFQSKAFTSRYLHEMTDKYATNTWLTPQQQHNLRWLTYSFFSDSKTGHFCITVHVDYWTGCDIFWSHACCLCCPCVLWEYYYGTTAKSGKRET